MFDNFIIKEQCAQQKQTLFFLKFFIFLSIALFSFNSCKVGPDYKKPELPELKEWTIKHPRIKTTRADISQWWKSFNDPILNSLIEKAYKQNLTLRMAGLKIMEARARTGLARGYLYPQFQKMNAGYTRYESSSKTFNVPIIPAPIEVDPSTSSWSLGLSAMWEIDLWGKGRRRVSAAKAVVLASIATYDDVLVALTAQVSDVYVLIRTLEQRLALAKANRRLVKRDFNISEARFENGSITEMQYKNSETSLIQSQTMLPKIDRGIKQAKNALCYLLSMTPDKIDQILKPGKMPKAPLEVTIGIPANLLRRRPDIRKAEFQAMAQCEQIGIAKAELYPQFNLIGSIGFQSSDLTKLFSVNSLSGLISAGFSWNIFNYGRIKNKVRVEDARFQLAIENYKNTVLRAYREVEDALVAYAQSKKQERYYLQTINSANRIRRLSEVRYSGGSSNYSRVINVKRLIISNMDKLTESREKSVRSLIALYKALGGGWQLRGKKNFIPKKTIKQMEKRTDWSDYLSNEKKKKKKVEKTIYKSQAK